MDEYSMFGFDSNQGPWWEGPINRGLDVLGAWASGSPYLSPDDPRYQQQQPPRAGYPQPQPQPFPQPKPQLQNDGAGIQVSKEMLMLGVGGVLLFMLGSRRR